MQTSLQDLIAQRAALDREIQEAERKLKADAIDRIHRLMNEHGLKLGDLMTPARRAPAPTGSKVAPKYRDPATGVTWSGRGLKPKWLTAALQAGQSIGDFVI